MAQEKRHLTTEQLSALLDGEVTAEEQAQWEAHLSTCPQCQHELARLRQTVTLLHALPQPTLPRSFLLPLEAAEPLVLPMAAPAPAPIALERQAQRRRLNPYVRGTLRTISALAALIGIVFFLSGVLPSLGMHRGGSATSSTSTGSSAMNPHTEPPYKSTRNAPPATKIAAASNTDTPAPTTVPTPTPTATEVVQPQTTDGQTASGSSQDVTSPGPTFLIFDLSSAAGRVGLGMALLILGLIGLVLFRRAQRRTG